MTREPDLPAAKDARAAILGRIQSALGGVGSAASADLAWAQLPRRYQRSAVRTPEETLHLLEDRLRDYDAHVERVTAETLSEAILRRLEERGHPAMLVPPGLPFHLPPSGGFTVDTAFTTAEIDRFRGVLTTASLAIATTGTLVLQNVPGQGRRSATLIPDYHLCIVSSTNVVETVPEAFDRLQPSSTLPTTFISGPSATADIEMTRIKGVHGPRVLDVLLVLPVPTDH